MKDNVESKTMILNTGDYFTLNDSPKESLFNGLSIFVRNNGSNVITVSTDGTSILISVEKETK